MVCFVPFLKLKGRGGGKPNELVLVMTEIEWEMANVYECGQFLPHLERSLRMRRLTSC